jgi:hypothetical protein
MEAVAARAARAPVEPATTLFDWWREECCWALVPGTLVRCLPGRRALLAPAAGWLLHGRPAGRPTLPTAAGCGVLAARVCQVCGRGRSGHFVGLSIVQQPTAAPGHPDWDGQADARWPRPWLAPGMWHPRIPLSSRMSRAARSASPVRDPPGAALTWVRRCLAVWEGRERPFRWGQFCCLLIDPARRPARVAPTVRYVEHGESHWASLATQLYMYAA